MQSLSSRSRTTLHLVLIVLAGVLVYSNSFTVPFLLDDETSIFDNPIVKDLNRFLSMEGYAYNPRRYLGYLTIALNYHFGGVNVVGYHVVNLLIHIASGTLVYWLARLTLKTPFFANRTPGSEGISRSFVPLVAALLFVSHPIQTQAVTYIVQRFASLSTLFYLLSVALYVKARLLSRETTRGGLWPTGGLFFCALLAAGCAMKTKEIAFTLPFIVILYEGLFFGGHLFRKAVFLVPVAITALVVPVSIIGLQRPLAQILSDLDTVTRAESQLSRMDYLFTQFPVVVTYIRLLFLPFGQNLDYDFPIYRSFFTPAVALSFVMLLGLFVLAVYLVRRGGERPEFRLISFGIFWFFVTLSVESSLIPIADVIFEHRVYLPSAGAFIALAGAVSLAASRMRTPSPAYVAVGVVVALLGGTAFARNMVWRSELSMWSDVVRKSPGKARPHYNLGLALYRAQRYDEALLQAQASARLDPGAADPYNLIGSILGTKGEFFLAITAFNEAARLDPKAVKARLNLGDTYRVRGLYQQALQQYEMALKLSSADPDIYYRIGAVHESTKAMDKAATFYGCAASLAPDRPEYLRDLSRVRAALER